MAAGWVHWLAGHHHDRGRAGNDGERQTVAAHGQRFTVAATARDTTCRAHAFGRVANYLDEHPCRGMQRHLLTTGTGSPAQSAAVATACVVMPDSASAGELAHRLRAQGAGDIRPLAYEQGADPGGRTRFDGSHYTAHAAGHIVRLAETAPIDHAHIPVATLRD